MDVKRVMPDRGSVSRPSRPLLFLLSSLAGSACLGPNPAFNPSADGGTDTVQDAGSTDDTGAPITTGGVDASGSGTTGGGASTTLPDGLTTGGEVSSEASTGGGSTGEDTTGGAAPGIYDVPADIGTCIFAANGENPVHGGPDECSGDADAINNTRLGGLMMVDVDVNDELGANRPAVPYLRFDTPEALVGLTVVSATLHVQVADGVTFLPQSGELWLSAPFTGQTLESEEPALIGFIAADKGEVQPDEWLVWQLDPDIVMPGQPLHLALRPTHDKGVLLRGATTTPGAPYLTLEVE